MAGVGGVGGVVSANNPQRRLLLRLGLSLLDNVWANCASEAITDILMVAAVQMAAIAVVRVEVRAEVERAPERSVVKGTVTV